MTTQPYAPDVAAIVAGLRSSHVYIDPTLTDAITATQLAQVKTTIAGSDTPIYIIAAPLDNDSLSPIQLVSLVHRQLPEDGVFFVSKPRYDGQWTMDSTSYGVSTDNANNLAIYVATELYPADLGLQLQKATELFTSGTARQAYDKVFPDVHTGTTSTTDDGGAHVLGMTPPVFGLSLGLAIALVLAVIPMARRRRRNRHELAIKGRALRRISSAQTDDWRHRAQTETDALGARIKTLQIAADSDRDAWTAALDHYDAASKVLDRSADAADSIGAMVLAQRGEDALEHAVAGTPWKPSVVCFFNPFHGAATGKATWATTVGAREVPCCAACRGAVRKRREPDFLDLPVDDTVVHYVDADAEPWASTGYGSLDPDLLSRV